MHFIFFKFLIVALGHLGAFGIRSYYHGQRVGLNQKRLLIAADNLSR